MVINRFMFHIMETILIYEARLAHSGFPSSFDGIRECFSDGDDFQRDLRAEEA